MDYYIFIPLSPFIGVRCDASWGANMAETHCDLYGNIVGIMPQSDRFYPKSDRFYQKLDRFYLEWLERSDHF